MGVISSDKSRKKKAAKKRRLHFREQKEEGGHYQETVGADLRMARSGRGMSLGDVANALKLKPDHIRAIEESDFDALPGKTYAIGFVRAYAELMGFKSEEFIRRFKAEMTGAEELKFNAITAKEKKKPFPLGQFITAAVTVVLAIVVWQKADVAIEAGGDVLEAFNPSLPEALTKEKSGQVKTQTATATETGHSEEGQGDISGPSGSSGPSGLSGSDSASDSVTQISGAVGDAGMGSPYGTRLVDRGPDRSVVEGTFWGSENHDARLRLRAVNDVWMRIEVEERVMFERVLKTGDSYAPPNSETTIIATRNAGGLEIYVDGGYVRRLGREGEALAGALLDPEAFLTEQ